MREGGARALCVWGCGRTGDDRKPVVGPGEGRVTHSGCIPRHIDFLGLCHPPLNARGLSSISCSLDYRRGLVSISEPSEIPMAVFNGSLYPPFELLSFCFFASYSADPFFVYFFYS